MSESIIGKGGGGLVTGGGAAAVISQTGVLPRTGGMSIILLATIAVAVAILTSMAVTKLQKRFS